MLNNINNNDKMYMTQKCFTLQSKKPKKLSFVPVPSRNISHKKLKQNNKLTRLYNLYTFWRVCEFLTIFAYTHRS